MSLQKGKRARRMSLNICSRKGFRWLLSSSIHSILHTQKTIISPPKAIHIMLRNIFIVVSFLTKFKFNEKYLHSAQRTRHLYGDSGHLWLMNDRADNVSVPSARRNFGRRKPLNVNVSAEIDHTNKVDKLFHSPLYAAFNSLTRIGYDWQSQRSHQCRQHFNSRTLAGCDLALPLL